MIARELVNHMIPPLKVTDDAHKAIVWMEELRCKQLPVVEKGHFLGFISEELILDENDIEKNIGEFELQGVGGVVSEDTHFYNILKISTDLNIQSVAVLDETGSYLGVITVQDIISVFAKSAAVQVPGGILVLSMDQRDYSLAEISRLIEENKVKILTANLRIDPLDPSMIKLTLKLNTVDLQRTIATLERFGYKIIAKFQETEVKENEKGRIDEFLRFLEI